MVSLAPILIWALCGTPRRGHDDSIPLLGSGDDAPSTDVVLKLYLTLRNSFPIPLLGHEDNVSLLGWEEARR
jgi:hypothetical protein